MEDTMINKCAALIIKDNKVLVVRKSGTAIFISAGGKIEPNETQLECLKREVFEELGVNVLTSHLYSCDSAKAEFENKTVTIYSYIVEVEGEPKPSSEISEIYWMGLDDVNEIKLGSILKNYLVPKLCKEGLLT